MQLRSDYGRFQRAAALLRQEAQRGLPATRLRRANRDADSTGWLCGIPASEGAARATWLLRDAAAPFRRANHGGLDQEGGFRAARRPVVSAGAGEFGSVRRSGGEPAPRPTIGPWSRAKRRGSTPNPPQVNFVSVLCYIAEYIFRVQTGSNYL
ncbi:hypothetical protein ZWY2020_019128 [Hordeum vulgare]|nr:hypothetical protein ZWY2020_019128 [Hordeum vulgare]